MATADVTPRKSRYVRVSARKYQPRIVKVACAHCAQPFEYESATGINQRRFCSDFCRGEVRHKNRRAKPLCVVDGCQNPRGYSSGICNSCYYRLRRTGTLDKREWAYRTICTNGYVKVSKVDHPLARGGFVYEHRKVLYDAIGVGPHPCHWCGVAVDWVVGLCAKGALVPDHLDGDRTNNAIANLVPTCNSCNASRGMFQAWVTRHANDPWLWSLYEKFIGHKINPMADGPIRAAAVVMPAATAPSGTNCAS